MPKGIPKWKELVKNFEDAVRAHAWIGGAHPDIHADIVCYYLDTKTALLDYLKKGERNG